MITLPLHRADPAMRKGHPAHELALEVLVVLEPEDAVRVVRLGEVEEDRERLEDADRLRGAVVEESLWHGGGRARERGGGGGGGGRGGGEEAAVRTSDSLARTAQRLKGMRPFGQSCSNHGDFCSFWLNEMGMTVYESSLPRAARSAGHQRALPPSVHRAE